LRTQQNRLDLPWQGLDRINAIGARDLEVHFTKEPFIFNEKHMKPAKVILNMWGKW